MDRRGPVASPPGHRSDATGPAARILRWVDDHLHAHAATDQGPLLFALVLIAGFMVAEVIVAAAAGSLALLADAGHMLVDAGAIGRGPVGLAPGGPTGAGVVDLRVQTGRDPVGRRQRRHCCWWWRPS